jgi:hypothetical protein
VVDGLPTLITTNLESALRRLRLVQDPRIIWADALCINQQDVDERSTRVALIGRIYEDCREVQIWLGEEDNICLHSFRSQSRVQRTSRKSSTI